jgi:hypothetical protein
VLHVTGGGLRGRVLVAVSWVLLGAPVALGEPAAPSPAAFSARTIAFAETGHLHAISRGGSAVTEEGKGQGTFSCSITVHLVIESAERVRATFTVRPREGTVSGAGLARLNAEGGTGYFGGTLAITKGTGAFAHASGRNIGFSGSFNRETLSAVVHVHGTVHT